MVNNVFEVTSVREGGSEFCKVKNAGQEGKRKNRTQKPLVDEDVCWKK